MTQSANSMAMPELELQPDWMELVLTRDMVIRGSKYFVPAAILFILAAFLMGWVSGPAIRRVMQNLHPGSGVTVEIPALPVVEPLILKPVSKVEAKKVNDATPFTESVNPAATPFFHFGSPADIARATDCLAATIFYEAGAEAVSGQMAAAQVVLNRVRHPAYPKTVCGVVFQGSERRTGCQFSYTCDGSMARRPSVETWQRHRALASAMLKGLVYAPVGLATHYHTDWVLPAWSARLEKVRVEATHLFFRYHGYWGSPAAFRGRVSQAEPSFAKMTGLSLAHGSPAPELDQADDEIAAATVQPLAEAPQKAILDHVSTSVDVEDPDKKIFLIYVDPLLEPAALPRMAAGACGARQMCKVLAWADEALLPRGLPIEPGDRASMAYSYIRVAGAKSGRSKWNCALFPRESKADCL